MICKVVCRDGNLYLKKSNSYRTETDAESIYLYRELACMWNKLV